MPDDDDPSSELAARLATAVVGSLLGHLLVAKALLLWTGDPDRLWRQLAGAALPWDQEGAVLGAAAGLGLVAGVALGSAERLAALGQRGASLLVALALAPLGAGAAAYGAEAVLGASPATLALRVVDVLDDPRLWGAAARIAVAWFALGGPLIHARLSGASPGRQARALALGGLIAFALAIPDLSSARRDRPFFSFSSFSGLAPLDAALLVSLLPAFVLPPCLGAGAWVATRILGALGQGAPQRPRAEPRPLRASHLLTALREPELARLMRDRLVQLGQEEAPLLRAAAVVLAASGALWAATSLASASHAWARPTLAAQHVLAVAVAAWLVSAGRVWPTVPSLLVGGLVYLAALMLSQGAAGLAAIGVAALAAGAASRVIPLAGIAFLVAAWPSYTAVVSWDFLPFSGWPACLPRPWDSVPMVAASLAGAAALWFARHGLTAWGPLLGLAAGALGAAWSTDAWIRAVYAETMVLWLFGLDAALLAALLGGAVGSWAARGGSHRIATALVGLALLVGGTTWATRGEAIEALPLRRLRQAAAAGDPVAMLELAHHLEVGSYTIFAAPRAEEAYFWFERAAATGAPRALVRLALRLEDGRVPRDRARALRLLDEAAARGDPDAAVHLERLTRVALPGAPGARERPPGAE